MTAVLERLDPRVLLAASLVAGTLTIEGTDGNDVIIVGLNKRFVNVVTVTFNDVEQHFSLSEIAGVSIIAGAGDDKIWIDSALDPLAWGSNIDGGPGDDMITCGAGIDRVTGGDGNDKIYGNAGADTLDGGAGRDSIWGGPDNDLIIGGAGNDLLVAEAGDDVILSGKGNDYCDGGDGNDSITALGNATVVAGAGNDTGKIAGAGIVSAGSGDDIFVSPGGASLYGEDGNDNLQSSWCSGGDGNDTLSGLLGDDQLLGGKGDDLIRGFAGHDTLYGDDGDDALFGGADDDTLYGGAGNDNLYGTDGYQDKHPELAGKDVGLGQSGADWFETGYTWQYIDRKAKEDRAVTQQVVLTQDPSGGQTQYLGGILSVANAGTLTLNGSGAITKFGGNSANLTVSGTNTYSGFTLINAGTLRIGGGNAVTGVIISSSIETQSLLPAGWLSSGAYDTAAQKFVPPPMSHTDRLAVKRVVLQIPAGWNLGAPIAARDDIVWYPTWQISTAQPAVIDLSQGSTTSINAPVTITGDLTKLFTTAGQRLAVGSAGKLTVIKDGTTTVLSSGTYVWNGTTLIAVGPVDSSSSEPKFTVPTPDGGTTLVTQSTPHLYDGVGNGNLRFIGVKRGTILISGSGSSVSTPRWIPLNSLLLNIPRNADIRIAGSETVYHTASTYASLPTGGPKKLRGIAVVGGGIWLPTDGTAPYFSSGAR